MPERRDAGAALTGRESLLLGAVLIATAVVYLRCLSDGFVFDDHDMVIGNRLIGQWSFLWKSLARDSWWFMDPTHLPVSPYYRPVQDVWLGLHFQLLGLNAAGWHATSVGLHLIAVWMVFEIAARLTGEKYTALVAALLFGLMPLHAEAVVWATAIPLPLSGTLELAAFYLFVARARAERRNGALALLLYACALLSHESAVVFPALIGLYVLLMESDPAARLVARIGTTLPAAAPFAAEALIYLLVHLLVVGAINATSGYRLTNRQALIGVPAMLATYLRLLVIPWTAGPAHRLLPPASIASREFWMPAAMLAAVCTTYVLATMNSARRRLYLFCAAWTGVALAPAMNSLLLRPDMLIQDRYLYLPSVGWCLTVAIVLADFARRNPRGQVVSAGAAAALLVVYAAVLWKVQYYWHDDVTLFTRCVADFPESQICHSHLGTALRRLGDPSGAERELSVARNLDPGDGRTLFELGQADAQLGRVAQGTQEVARGLSMLPNASAYAYMVLAQLYYLNGEPAQSEAVLKHTETLFDGAHAAGLARARIAIEGGDAAGAETLLSGLTSSYPDDERLWAMLGQVLAQRGRNEQALSAYDEAAKLTPGDPAPRLAAAQLLHAMNRDREALDECHLALAASPNDRGALVLMTEIERGAAPH